MRTNTLILWMALSMTGLHASAQQKPHTFSITPKAGITVNSFSGDMPVTIFFAKMGNTSGSDTEIHSYDPNDAILSENIFTDDKASVGFTIGAEGQYQFNHILGLSVGALYEQIGCHYNTKGFQAPIAKNSGYTLHVDEDLSMKLGYIAVPVLANVYLWRGLAVKAGLQPEFLVHKKVNGSYNIVNEASSGAVEMSGQPVSPDYIESFNLSLPVGVSYEYHNFIADVRYNIGLMDMLKDSGTRYTSGSVYNRTLTVTLGYKINL
ncbi:MAG: porin family protein [Prevotella sp.]|nr:porin family protein [Prevotella sp.]